MSWGVRSTRGMVAAIGRPAGFVQAGPIRLTGRLGFYTLVEIHLLYLEGRRNRVSALVNLLWTGATRGRGAALLVEPPADERPEGPGRERPVVPEVPGAR